jgi:hypothetical protein
MRQSFRARAARPLVNGLDFPYDARNMVRRGVFKRLTIIASVVALGLTLGGCSKCGFWWDDWQWPRACKDERPKP